MGISNNLTYLNKYDDAIVNCDKAYDIAKNNGEKRFALFTKAVAYVDAGKTDNALEEIQKQFDLAKNINDAGAMAGNLNVMGNILFEAERYDEARIKFEEVLSVINGSDLAEEVKDNNRRLNLYNMGRIALMTGNISEAKMLADKFITGAEEKNNTFQIWLAHSLNGMIALQEKDYKKAISEFEKSSLQNPQTFYFMALAYSGDGNTAEVKKCADKCANFNSLINLNQAFARNKAKEMSTTL
jgi:tetratricopeptide (TPR) repeat protein